MAEYRDAIGELGMPCVVKPVMSSSGKGQSVVRTQADVERAWEYAQQGGRAGKGRVIVEGLQRAIPGTKVAVTRKDATTGASPPAEAAASTSSKPH